MVSRLRSLSAQSEAPGSNLDRQMPSQDSFVHGSNHQHDFIARRCTCGECGAPVYIAWSGKRQWMELLNVGRKGKERYKKLDQGLQHMRPEVKSSCCAHQFQENMCSVCRACKLQLLMLSCMLTHDHKGSIVQQVPWKA